MKKKLLFPICVVFVAVCAFIGGMFFSVRILHLVPMDSFCKHDGKTMSKELVYLNSPNALRETLEDTDGDGQIDAMEVFIRRNQPSSATYTLVPPKEGKGAKVAFSLGNDLFCWLEDTTGQGSFNNRVLKLPGKGLNGCYWSYKDLDMDGRLDCSIHVTPGKITEAFIRLDNAWVKVSDGENQFCVSIERNGITERRVFQNGEWVLDDTSKQ